MKTIEKWQRYELTLHGPELKGEYSQVDLTAKIQNGANIFTVRGFYAGGNDYKVRYMPQEEGLWQITVESNIKEINGQTDSFQCVPASKGNHGPVVVENQTHFAYSDGTPYLPFGTTAYAWTLQDDSVQQQTLKTLKENKFNKVRMTVFPKYFNYNTTEPKQYPYEGKPKHVTGTFQKSSWMVDPEDSGFNFGRFNPEYFDHLENCIDQLDKLGIEADLILFHPYDSWGFARMGKEYDTLYMQYIIARLASFKNVWWALANEFDYMAKYGQKPLSAWDYIGQTVRQEDPSGHLLSIHNWYNPPVHKGTTSNWYDQTKPWITHLSLQTDNLYFVPQWLNEYRKPIVVDECRYEGNLELGWGDNTAHNMVDSFWRVVLRGGYCTHGETYIDEPETKRPIWWAHGGQLFGESHKRIDFLKKIIEDNDFKYFKPMATDGPHWELAVGSNQDGSKVLAYVGDNQPGFEIFNFLPENTEYTVKLIDTWNMTIEDFPKEINSTTFFKVPDTNYKAFLLLRK